MTDKKPPLTTEPKKSAHSRAPVTNTAKAATKQVSTKETTDNSKDKVSKLALLAIVIALGSTAGHYFWQQQQSQLLTAKLSEQIKQIEQIERKSASFNQFQSQIKQTINKQQRTFGKKLQQLATQVNNNDQQAKITELNALLSELERKVKQRQPSDWILHEAEYLIRIATRTLWLEKDTTGAIGLLKNADARLADLKDPTILPVRELVHQDIKSLELMPTLQTDEVVLTLMAMNKQIAMLSLAMVEIGAENSSSTNDLSDNLNDWQANLAKTWEKFLNDFIRVRQRTGMIEPLVSPEQQQHLKQNLNLKIQLALWAASEHKNDVYQEALTDMKRWFTEFFDLNEASNQHFLQSITDLQTKRISYDYPNKLSSLTAVRRALRDRTVTLVALPAKPQAPASKTTDDATEALTEKMKQPDAVKTTPVAVPTKPKVSPTKTSDDAKKALPEKKKQPNAVKTTPVAVPTKPKVSSTKTTDDATEALTEKKKQPDAVKTAPVVVPTKPKVSPTKIADDATKVLTEKVKQSDVVKTAPVTVPTKPKVSPTKIADDATKALTEKVKQSDVVKTKAVVLPAKIQVSPTKTVDDATEVLADKVKQPDVVKTEPKKLSSLPKNQDNQPNVEGIK